MSLSTPSTYVKLDQNTHILKRPDMYCGSTRPRTHDEYVATPTDIDGKSAPQYTIEKKTITTPPALVRIFIEALSNAIDNVQRSEDSSTPCTQVKVSIDAESGRTRVSNDGAVVPIVKDSVEKCYNHSMIFGQLLTGSNYDDNRERTVSGRNGLGIKLCLAKGTMVLDASGRQRPVETFTVGDYVMGDDGQPTRISARCEGRGPLYTVTQRDGQSYTVNGEHRMTLCMPSHKRIVLPSKENEGYSIEWLDVESKKVHVDSTSYRVSEYETALESMETVPDVSVLDISVHDYLALPVSMRNQLHGCRAFQVEWKTPSVPSSVTHCDAYGYGKMMHPSQRPDRTRPILDCYMHASVEMRMLVLAGLLDGEAFQTLRVPWPGVKSVDRLLPSIRALARTVGITTAVRNSTLVFTGERAYSIPVKTDIHGSDSAWTPRYGKTCMDANGTKVVSTGPIQVREKIFTRSDTHESMYIGLQVTNRSRRFLLGDCTITHNCNIFSDAFTVTGIDPDRKLKLVQTWTNNMRETKGPKVSSSGARVKGSTVVEWVPDFKQFGMKGYTSDVLHLYARYVIDAAMLSGVNVHLNGKPVGVKKLEPYAKLYTSVTEKEKLVIRTETASVLLTPAPEFQVMSFVNGVYTRLGGEHVDAWTEALFRPIVEKYNGTGHASKRKAGTTTTGKIHIGEVKQCFALFVVATVDRPEFNGQEKERLDAPSVRAQVTPAHIRTICKWPSVTERIQAIIRSKQTKVMKTAETRKRVVKIDGLDPANNAGGKRSSECTLIICEGLSAKTYAVAGIEQGVYGKKGRDWFGILPLTGKMLNVRNAKIDSIAGNKVVTRLIQALGLKHGVDYTQSNAYATLNYGRVMVMTDADVDGIHIEGLLANFFHALYPSLLKRRDPPYLVSMKTPIARVMYGRSSTKKDQLFYDEQRFTQWVDGLDSASRRACTIKYYKGLGTTRPEDVPDTFGRKMIEYTSDANVGAVMDKVFHSKQADARKEWLASYIPDASHRMSLDDVGESHTMPLSVFVNTEMVKFSHADCARSIPSAMDGLKESQRKIMYSVRKRKLTFHGPSLKVAQLSGYTAEHSNYHHGEQNLQDTIIGMANEFPGTNNIPLLYRDGMFGTRLEGAHDAASARYIFTKMDALTEYIYRAEDDPLLEHVFDDGERVQPKFYMPILPMVLVNGCSAIGTGWSSTIPCYNPKDMISAVRIWIDHGGDIFSKNGGKCVLPEYTPWYRGFTGPIEKATETSFKTHGIVSGHGTASKKTVRVSELPIGMWTNKFKETCETMILDKKLKGVNNYSTPRTVDFILSPEQGTPCTVSSLKLTTSLSTNNMVLFTANEQLKKHASVHTIIDDFCRERSAFYTKRKTYMMKTLERELRHASNKKRFVTDVIARKLDIMNVDEPTIVSTLKNRRFDTEDGDYEYLLRLHVRTFTKEKVSQLCKLCETLENKLYALKKTSPHSLWRTDLDALEEAYEAWLETM